MFCWFKPLNYIKKGFLKEWTWHQFEHFSYRERGMKFSETIQSTKNSSTWSRKTMPSCRRIRWRGWHLRGASSTTWSKNSSEYWTQFHWKVLMPVIHRCVWKLIYKADHHHNLHVLQKATEQSYSEQKDTSWLLN